MRRALFIVSIVATTVAGGCQLVLSFGDDARPGSGDAGDTGPDAFTEASVPSDAATPATGCGKYADARFCSDFEGSDPLDAQTWPRQERDAATAFVAPVEGFDGTTSLRFAAPPTGSSACDFTWVGRKFDTSFSRIQARAMIRAKSQSGGMLVWQVVSPQDRLYLLGGSLQGELTMELVFQTVDAVDAGTVAKELDVFETSPVGRWEPVSLTLDLVAHLATFTYGAATVKVPLPPEFPNVDPLLTVGPWCNRTAAEWDVDDVVVYVDP